MIISIELMLLAVTLLVLVSSYQFDDTTGQTYSIYIIAIASLPPNKRRKKRRLCYCLDNSSLPTKDNEEERLNVSLVHR